MNRARAAMSVTWVAVAVGRSDWPPVLIRSRLQGLAPIRPSSTASLKIVDNSDTTSITVASANDRRSDFTHAFTVIRLTSPNPIAPNRGRMWLRR
jgi:hypothetical protein